MKITPDRGDFFYQHDEPPVYSIFPTTDNNLLNTIF